MEKRKIEVKDGIATIPLTMGRVAIIDAVDLALVEGFNWTTLVRTRKSGIERIYAGRVVGKKWYMLHQVINGTVHDHVLIDHKDNDGLNNRRNNLRIANYSQNGANNRKRVGTSSKYKGVGWDESKKKWMAYVTKNQKRIYLGRFEFENDAAEAYNRVAREYFGEFAQLNVIDPNENRRYPYAEGDSWETCPKEKKTRPSSLPIPILLPSETK